MVLMGQSSLRGKGVEDFVRCVGCLSEDLPLSVRLGTLARALAEREFDESKIMGAYLDVDRSVGALPE
jgi:hypothetical protein